MHEERSADDEPFGKRHAGLRAELRIAALDELLETGGRQPRGHRIGTPQDGTELAWHASARRFVS